MAKERRKTGDVKILLCTATNLEDDILAEVAKSERCALSPSPGKRGTYKSLGKVGWGEVTYARSQMGTVGSGASELTTLDALDDLHPAYVISCGIGFGRSRRKQALGDVMVSEWVRLYDKQRRGARRIIPRGDRISASPLLIQAASAVRVLYKDATVHMGGILSGDKLVDNPEFKKSLWRIEPEAIGGDMEAAGVVSACYRRSIPWIVVKGICDWGEGKGDAEQELAARTAIRFVFDMLLSGQIVH